MRWATVACVVLLGACRIGFDAVGTDRDGGGDDGGRPAARITVRPQWATPAGTTITVTFLDETDATGASVMVDGTPCTSPRATGNELACETPAHVPGVVQLAAAAGSTNEVAPFIYLAPGLGMLGGGLDDSSSGIAVDGDGNTYVVGGTTSSFDQPNAGDFDAFLVKFDGAGALAWTREIGTPGFDYIRDVAIDPSNEITVVGYTTGSLDGANAGSNDVFVARYRSDGTRRWLTQFGSAGDDQSWDLAVDAAGFTVVALRTTDNLGAPPAGGFDYGIARLDPDGAVMWIRQGGTAVADIGHSITCSADGVAYLIGYTMGSVETSVTNAGAYDLFVARYEPDGTQTWIHQLGGAGDDRAQDATVDDTGDIWVVGSTTGALDGQAALGGMDVFVTRWSPSGALQMTRLYGGAGDQNTFAISVAPGGPAYIGCSTTAAFDGQPFAGGTDVCAISIDRTGLRRWTRIMGTAAYDTVSGGAVAPVFSDLVLFSIISAGPLGGIPNQGSNDMGFVRFRSDGSTF